MKKVFQYLIILITLSIMGCSSKILISKAKYESSSYGMFGNIPERNFYVPKTIGDSIKLKWSSEIHGSFANTSITAFQDYIFVSDLSGRIFSFDIENGKELGQIKYKGTINTTPVINHFGVIFPVTEYKEPKTTIYNYNFQQGTESSEIEIEGNVNNELQKSGDEILFITEEGKAYKYHLNTEKIWEFDTKTFAHSSPVLIKGSFIFGNDKGEVISLNAQSGALNFRIKLGNTFESGFSASNDTIYCADNSGVVYAIGLTSGNLIWKYKTGYKITLTPVFDKDYLFVGNLRGDIYKIEKRNGRLIWKITTNGVIDTTPLVFDDYLLQPDLDKKLYFIDKNKGTIAKTIKLENRAKLSPVYFNGKLFLGIDNGKILAYDIVSDQLSQK